MEIDNTLLGPPRCFRRMAVIARLYRLRWLGKRGKSKGGVQNAQEDDEYRNADCGLREPKGKSATETRGHGRKAGV